MGARKKNLSKSDLEDVSTWETLNAEQTKKIQLNDIKINVKCLNQKQKLLKKAIEEKEITISIGSAGTGKTYLSLITAFHLMKTQPQYRKLYLVKSLQTIKGEEPGLLPGTLEEKLDPYMGSFTSNIDKILGDKNLRKALMADDVINIEPIAYIRGKTFDNAIVIVDETQNIDIHTFKTIVTRIGKSSKMIFIGDIEQVDRRQTKESCLDTVFTAFENAEFTGAVKFEMDECVRNPIIPEVLKVLNTI